MVGSKRERTRAAILEQALELFATRGYARTSMSDIAEAAGVVRQTVLNHFPRKEDLVTAWGLARRESLEELLEAAPDDGASVVERLRALYATLARRNDDERALARELEPVFRFVEFRQPPVAVQRLLALGIADGSLRADLDLDVAGRVLTAVYFDTLTRWLEEPGTGSLAAPLLAHLDCVIVGLAA